MPLSERPQRRSGIRPRFALLIPAVAAVGMLLLAGQLAAGFPRSSFPGASPPVFSQSAPFANASVFGGLTYHETSAHYLNCADAVATVPASVNTTTGSFTLGATASAVSRASCRPSYTGPLESHGSYIDGNYGLTGPAFQVPTTGNYSLNSNWTLNWNIPFNLHHIYPAGSVWGDLSGTGYVAIGFGYAAYGGPLKCVALGRGGLPTCFGLAYTSLALLPWSDFVKANKSLTFGQVNASRTLKLTNQHLQSATNYELFAYIGVFLHTKVPARFPAGTTLVWTIELGTRNGPLTLNSWSLT